MGQFFRESGYVTAYVGKWHLDGTDYFGTGNCPSGWNPRYWYDGRNYLEDLSADERGMWRSGLRSAEAIEKFGVTRDWTWAGRNTELARRFIRNHAVNDPETPYLLVVSYDEPHGPSVCPPPFHRMYEDHRHPLPSNHADSMEDKPRYHREWAERFSFDPAGLTQQLYFGATSFVDDEIGRVVAAADEYDRENTLAIFTSDHGHYMGAHGLDGKGPALYEEVMRVPLIFRGLGLPAGAEPESLVSHLDVIPTCLSLAGITPPPILQGFDQSPMLHVDECVRDHVVCGFQRFSVTHDDWFGHIPIRSIVSSRWKLTINLDYADELYDLEEDPGELTNLISDPACSGIAETLHEALLAVMDDTRDPFRGPMWSRREWSSRPVQPGFGGERRPRPADGRNPVPYNYNTGMPGTPASTVRPKLLEGGER